MLVFMDTETFEQIELPADLLSDRLPFLQDGMNVVIEYYGEEALNITLPEKVICEIVDTEPVVKGQTQSNSFKPAVLDNGMRITVPPFISIGEKIEVMTESFEYSGRVS
jgi:elongation factor P